VRKAARGEAVMHPHVAARIAQALADIPHIDEACYALLSDREREVLRLIAEGLPNGEIARRLIISEKTVKSHVSNILSKLQLVDRTQAAVFAWREGLMWPGHIRHSNDASQP
jgi:two-component system, NarL family, response regulator LiaR